MINVDFDFFNLNTDVDQCVTRYDSLSQSLEGKGGIGADEPVGWQSRDS